MPTTLNLFPARAPIGRVMDSSGQARDVMMTPEFARALNDLMTRLGGTTNYSTDELLQMFGTEGDNVAMIGTLRATVAELSGQLAAALEMNARLACISQQVDELAKMVHSSTAPPTDWEHPGKIGAGKANIAKFTDATVTTLNKLTFTQPANNATWTISDGKTFNVANTITLAGTDGATLNIAGGGTLGTAAFQNSNAFAARTATAFAVNATDPASTQALANSIKTILISVGIGT